MALRIALGTLPDWLAGVGTVGSLFFLAVHGRRERRRRRADEQQGLAERRDRDAAQARLTTVELAWQYGPGFEAMVVVHNHSAGPLLDVRVLLVDHGTIPSHDESPPAGPTEETASTIGPGEDRRFRLHPPRRLPPPRDGDDAAAYQAPGQTFGAQVEFTDTAGLRWQRTGSEQPQRVIQQRPALPDHRHALATRKS